MGKLKIRDFSDPNDIKIKNRVNTYVNVEDFGAKGDGITDDTIAIQNANTYCNLNKCSLVFTKDVYLISDTITILSWVNWIGKGKYNTRIKLKNNSNVTMFKSYNYATHEAMENQSSYDETNSSFYFSFKGLCIDGNKANNTSGHGVLIIGGGFKIEDVMITNVAQVGLLTGGRIIDYDVTIDVDIFNCGEEGFIFRGPGDIYLKRLMMGYCMLTGVSSHYPSLSKPSAVIIDKSLGTYFTGSGEIGKWHVHNCNGYGVSILGTGRIKAEHLMVENNYGGIFTDYNNFIQISILDLHNNSADSGDGYYDFYWTGLYGQIGTLEVRNENAHTHDSIYITGQHKEIASLLMKGYDADCVGLTLDCNESKIGGIIEKYGTGVKTTSNCARNTLDLVTSKCTTHYNNSNIGNFNVLTANIRDGGSNTFFSNTAYDHTVRRNNITVSANDGSNMIAWFPSTRYRTGLLNLTLTTEQTITFAHKYPFIPMPQNIKINIYNPTATDFVVAYAYVSAIDATNITVKIKLTTASTTPGAVADFSCIVGNSSPEF